MDSQSIITNCPLCEEKSLHIIGEDEYQTQQCINCGYATAPRYKLSDDLDKEKCESYMALTEEMKSWSKLSRDYIWIPTILTLPFGLLFPQNNEDGNLHWGFAKLINLTEEEYRKDEFNRVFSNLEVQEGYLKDINGEMRVTFYDIPQQNDEY